MLDRYLIVTAEDIQAVAQAVIRRDNRVVLTYLPELPGADSAAEPGTQEEVAA